jgi:hypothetical protein
MNNSNDDALNLNALDFPSNLSATDTEALEAWMESLSQNRHDRRSPYVLSEREKADALDQIMRQYETEAGRRPTTAHLSGLTGLPREEVAKLLQLRHKSTP